MRTFLEVLRFECVLHARSPLFPGLLILFFLIHLLTMGQVGIHLSDNQLVAVNSAHLVVRTEVVLALFGMLPAVAFVVSAAVRDHERHTAEYVLALPVAPPPFLLSRFAGGALCALLVCAAGLAGTLAGTWLPWLDPQRVQPFTAWPYVVSYVCIVAPTVLAFCALAFTVGALTRASLPCYGVALLFVVLGVIASSLGNAGGPEWLAVLDPFGAVAVEGASRHWSIAELNTRLPVNGWLVANRLTWLAVGALAVGFALRRVRLDFPGGAASSATTAGVPSAGAPTIGATHPAGTFVASASVRQLPVQAEADLRAVFGSPLCHLVLLLAAVATVVEARSLTSLILDLPLRPVTALMLGFFRYNLLQFVLVLLIVFAGALIHREREHRLHEIVGAAPVADWVFVVSKSLALCALVAAVLVTATASAIAVQLFAGHRPLEPAVYGEGLLVYDGWYFSMLAVLAVAIHALSPGRWSGTALTLVAFVALLSAEAAGFEDLLYGFRLPTVIYSDMNGFGGFRAPALVVGIYWGAFCVVLLSAAHLALARGTQQGLRERFREARTRLTPGVRGTLAVAVGVFATTGAWIFYNTHVLNAYETAASRRHDRAEYERRYARYRNAATPSFSDIRLEVDLFPDQLRLESRGRATLLNRRPDPIEEVVASLDPRLRLHELRLDEASVVHADVPHGFYIFRLQEPMRPGDTRVLHWQATRHRQGFANAGPDADLVANGTFVDLQAVMPIPAYDEERQLTDPADRRREGLLEAPRLPALGDAAHLNTLGLGVDGRTQMHTVVSTSADQTAVVPGALRRRWTEAGRAYFEYEMERPVWPSLTVSSARYRVARARWEGVTVEVYHDPTHHWNAPIMLDTAMRALPYFSREFAPYPLSHFRILEYPRYRTAATAAPGTVPYSEAAGFLTDLRGWATLDYATVHELAHQWWGGMAYGARMQGRQVLNETLAQYSTLMVFKALERPQWLRQILASTLDGYLDGRSRETVGEQPLIRTEDQGYISYNKGALVMFALQDLLGADAVHLALRRYLDRFGMQPPPFPTSRDLVNELRAVAGPEHQRLITDLFERIVFYDLRADSGIVRPVADGFEVTIAVTGRQVVADARGREAEEPLDGWFDVVIFPAGDGDPQRRTPLYQAKHRLRSGSQQVTVRVPARPGAVGVDPFHLMIDRTPGDNVVRVP